MGLAHPVRRPCGTDAGYSRHHYHGEEPCKKCKDAHALAERLRYARRLGLPEPVPVITTVGKPNPLWWFDFAACQGGRQFLDPPCGQCPVQRLCLWYGVAFELPSLRFGTYGGMSPGQRGRLGVGQGEALEMYQTERDRAWTKLVGAATL